MQPSSGDWVPHHWQTVYSARCVIEGVVTCSNQTSLKRKEFSKSVVSAAHWPRQEGELDLFPLIRPPHLLTKSILLLRRPLFHRGPRPVKRADNFDSSSHRPRSASVPAPLFQVLWSGVAQDWLRLSVSIPLWRVHPLASHLIARSSWPRNQPRATHHTMHLCSSIHCTDGDVVGQRQILAQRLMHLHFSAIDEVYTLTWDFFFFIYGFEMGCGLTVKMLATRSHIGSPGILIYKFDWTAL